MHSEVLHALGLYRGSFYTAKLPIGNDLNHTLSIWLEMEFTSDIFLKTSVCAHYSQTIFKINR